MIPILYSVDELDFTSNGIGRLVDCASCIVTEERNGIYECEFQYPITGRFYMEMIKNGGIISVIHDDTKTLQLFDIYAHTDPIDGLVTFNAHHISYRLSGVLLYPFEGVSVSDTLQRIPLNAVNGCPFTFWTDKPTVGDFKLIHPSNARSILAGEEGSILDVYGGGDYEFDNFTVRLYADKGFDTGVTIRYGKNLMDVENSYDLSGSFSAVLPYWIGSEDEVVYGSIVYSDTLRTAMLPWTKESGEVFEDGNGNSLEFPYAIITPISMDCSEYFEEQPTVEELENFAKSFMSRNKTWEPDHNITIDFVQMWQTPEYQSVAALQRVSLCDYVSIYFPEMGIVSEGAKVIRTVYNVLLERYDEMELGKAKTTLGETLTREFNEALSAQSTFLKNIIQTQTDLITGGLGGYVVMNLNAAGEPQEILIMDTDDMTTAVNVIRMNKNGIGFSSHGYAGPFESAWTIDGKFNADFISAGHMFANFIQGGTLTLGGMDNESGVMVVNDYNGVIRTRIDYLGIDTNSLYAYGAVDINAPMHGSIIMPGNGPDSTIEMSSGNGFLYRQYCTPSGYTPFFNSYKIYATGFIIQEEDTNSYWILSPNEIGGHDQHDQTIPQVMRFSISDGSHASIITSNGISTNGTKNRVLNDDQLGEIRFFCYETPSPLFGDVGEGVLDETGVCIIDLDPLFAYSTTLKGYQVFLQKYGQGDCWVSERDPGFFVVEGTPGMAFGWEIKARQSEYDQVRYNDPYEHESNSEGAFLRSVYAYMNEIIERSITA